MLAPGHTVVLDLSVVAVDTKLTEATPKVVGVVGAKSHVGVGPTVSSGEQVKGTSLTNAA